MTSSELLEKLFAETDKLMEEIKQNTIPFQEIIENFLKRIAKYPYLADASVDVYEHNNKYHIYLDTWSPRSSRYELPGECRLKINNEYWSSRGVHDQKLIALALPELLKQFQKNVKKEHLVLPESIKLRRRSWKTLWL